MKQVVVTSSLGISRGQVLAEMMETLLLGHLTLRHMLLNLLSVRSENFPMKRANGIRKILEERYLLQSLVLAEALEPASFSPNC